MQFSRHLLGCCPTWPSGSTLRSSINSLRVFSAAKKSNTTHGKKPKGPAKGPGPQESSTGRQKYPPPIERLIRAFFTPRERPQKSAERLREDQELAKRFSRLRLRQAVALEHSFHLKNWLQRQAVEKLPAKLRKECTIPDLRPFPSYRELWTDTLPVEGIHDGDDDIDERGKPR